jgi:hypothetical protein
MPTDSGKQHLDAVVLAMELKDTKFLCTTIQVGSIGGISVVSRLLPSSANTALREGPRGLRVRRMRKRCPSFAHGIRISGVFLRINNLFKELECFTSSYPHRTPFLA